MMSYLKSIQYIESKHQLKGEYEKAFMSIEKFYVNSYPRQSIDVQIALHRILDNFLAAQKEGKPLTEVIGSDIKKYALKMIDTGSKVKKLVSYIAALLWLALFLIFIDNMPNEIHKGAPLPFIVNQLIIPLSVLLTEFIRGLCKRYFFFKPDIYRYLNFMLTFLLTLLIIFREHIPYGSVTLVQIPFSVFITLFVASTIFIIVALCISIIKTKLKKRYLSV